MRLFEIESEFNFITTCVDIDDNSFCDATELAYIDENAINVSKEEFKEITSISIPSTLEDKVYLLYPNVDHPYIAIIYDDEQDIHHIWSK